MANFKITKIIEKKRDGGKLTNDEIQHFIDSVVKSAKTNVGITDELSIDRSQIGAMLMAFYLKGLDKDEASKLTETMTNSGYIFSWPEEWRHLVVDKHSTGGVGDKVSLVLAPALAAVGLKVPMISGRSLSHTGGTLDKLESIPGFRVCLTKKEIYEIVNSVGCCIVGLNEDCAPADKILYHCREITATVDSPPLVVASIVSKKLSEGIKSIVYDVKYGKGSVFSCMEDANETARNLVQSSRDINASALLTSMENPLGRAIGNSVEVLEAIECLKGRGPSDVMRITCDLGAELLQSARGERIRDGRNLIQEVLENGKALEKFEKMIIFQGVSEEIAKELCYGNANSVLPKAQHQTDILYEGEDGYIQEINPLTLATFWKEELAQSNRHLGVGLTLLKVVGDEIKKGEAWLRLHHQTYVAVEEMEANLKKAIIVGESPRNRDLIKKRVYMSEKSTVKEMKYSYDD